MAILLQQCDIQNQDCQKSVWNYLDEINQETVEFTPNFDATIEEPVYLPAKIPNLIIKWIKRYCCWYGN